MSTTQLLVIAIVAVVVLIIIGVVLVAVGLFSVHWLTGIYHAFKPQPPPSRADFDWDRKQGKEAGGEDDTKRPSR